MTEHEIDDRRLPYEIKYWIEHRGESLVEQLEPGLNMRVEGGEMVVLSRGVEVGRIPRPCLERLDLGRLATYLDERGDVAAAATVREHPDRVVDDPAGVYVTILLSISPAIRQRVHRSVVVDDWPDDNRRGDEFR